jgi:hypothetical protein
MIICLDLAFITFPIVPCNRAHFRFDKAASFSASSQALRDLIADVLEVLFVRRAAVDGVREGRVEALS